MVNLGQGEQGGLGVDAPHTSGPATPRVCCSQYIGRSGGILVTGGRDEPTPFVYSNQAFFYDLNLELWAELCVLPEPQGFHRMGLLGEGVGDQTSIA